MSVMFKDLARFHSCKMLLKNCNIYPRLFHRCRSILSTSLDQTPPGFEVADSDVIREKGNGDIEISALSNGLHVATIDTPGHFASMGIALEAGSAREALFTSGISNFTEKLAFRSTNEFKGGRNEITRQMELYNGLFDCQSSRDCIIYAISINQEGVEWGTQLLNQVVFEPLLSDEDMAQAVNACNAEAEMRSLNPEKHAEVLNDWIHQAAFRNNTLGLPRWSDAPEQISVKDVRRFMSMFYKYSNAWLVGVGIDHSTLRKAAESIFVECPNESTKITDSSVSQYTGGCILKEEDLSNITLGPYALPNCAHVVLGFESPNVNDEQAYLTSCVLQTLLGGGKSFSQGGPGKGLYSRLYLRVLNRNYYCHDAMAYNCGYQNSGLFYIHGSCEPPSNLNNLVTVLCQQLVAITDSWGVSTDELERAKTQTLSKLLMHLEQRPAAFEELAKQCVSRGSFLEPTKVMELIRAVSAGDIVSLGRRMLSSPVSVVAHGDLANMPSIEEIRSMLVEEGFMKQTYERLKSKTAPKIFK